MMSGGLSLLDSARQPMPIAIRAAAATAEWRAGLGLGGRPERASVTGTRATARPGHQAAAVAPRTATRTTIASSVHGRLSRSRRWSSAVSSVGTSANQSPRPTTVPSSAPIAPTTAPLVITTSRRCFSVAPIAASMPSWRSRRCAMTAKPAAATSEARSRNTVATENISSSSAGLSLPRIIWSTTAGPGSRSWAQSGAVGQDGDVVRRPGGRGRDEGELVAQIGGVLDDADDGPACPSRARVSPISSPSSSATPSVTATWRLPTG